MFAYFKFPEIYEQAFGWCDLLSRSYFTGLTHRRNGVFVFCAYLKMKNYLKITPEFLPQTWSQKSVTGPGAPGPWKE